MLASNDGQRPPYTPCRSTSTSTGYPCTGHSPVKESSAQFLGIIVYDKPISLSCKVQDATIPCTWEAGSVHRYCSALQATVADIRRHYDKPSSIDWIWFAQLPEGLGFCMTNAVQQLSPALQDSKKLVLHAGPAAQELPCNCFYPNSLYHART